MRGAGLVVLSLASFSGVLGAQQPTRPDTTHPAPRVPNPADTAQPVPRIIIDSAAASRRADSTQNPHPDQPVTPRDTSKVLPDSVNPDSLRPVMPSLGNGAGPRPGETRVIFNPDELRWSGAISLGELLERIPGVFVVKAGAYGQPETVSYQGQGGASIEIYRDGYQLDPLGEDSTGFDLSRFDIGQYRRIEVEVLPTVLRVYLITDTQTSTRAKTEASFATGDNNTNSYRVRYLNRSRNGAGVSLGVSYGGTQGPATSRASSNELILSGKISWLPTDRSGVEVEAMGYNLSSDTIFPLLGGTPYAARTVRRTDLFVRGFAATRADGMGLRFDAIVGSSDYGNDSHLFNRSEEQASFTLGYRAGHWSTDGWTRFRDTQVPIEVGGRGTLSPFRLLTLSGYARHQATLDDQFVNETSGAAEVRLLPWLSLHGDTRWRQAQGRLFVASDTIQTAFDYSAGGGIATHLFSVDASYTQRGDFSAPTFGVFAPQLPTLPTIGTNAFQINWRFQPRLWLTLSGWFRNPSNSQVSYDPPTHSVSRVTFRSSFLPTYRRNAFDLEFIMELEAWGSGIEGLDSTGAAVKLVGHSVINYYLQFRLVGAIIYWAMRNSQFEHYTLLPGFVMPRSLQRFGIRWEFAN